MLSRRTLLGAGAIVAAGTLCNLNIFAATGKKRVVVWSEGTAPKSMYPNDINGAVAEGLRKNLSDWEITTAGLKDPNQGITDELLKQTDVLMWWGHQKHGDVKNELVEKIVRRVKEDGMGFISLHSSHFAKPWKKIMGTACSWGDYKTDSSAKVIVKAPDHPIARGVKDFELPQIERYAMPYAVPKPDTVVLDGIYTRSNGKQEPGWMGLCWKVGQANTFYFTPGHETYNDFFRDDVQRIMSNAVQWAAKA